MPQTQEPPSASQLADLVARWEAGDERVALYIGWIEESSGSARRTRRILVPQNRDAEWIEERSDGN